MTGGQAVEAQSVSLNAVIWHPLSSTAGQRPLPDSERATDLLTGRLRLASWSLTPVSWSLSLRIQRLPPHRPMVLRSPNRRQCRGLRRGDPSPLAGFWASTTDRCFVIPDEEFN